MDKVRIGMIGFGNMGSAHAKVIANNEIPGLALTCICDNDEVKRTLAAERYPHVPVYAEYAELLKSGLADAVVIATPHCFHSSIAAAAMYAGLHVLSEKPADVAASRAREAIKAARDTGKVYAIMFNQRTNPLFRRAKEIVESGALGERKRAVWIITNWYRTQAYYDSGAWRATWGGEGGGVLLNQAPHNLDILQWIFGMPRRIRAFCSVAKYHNIEVEDDATIYAEYENGATATFITTTGECPGTNRLEISGDLGKLVLEDGRLKWWRLSEHEREFCFTSSIGMYQPEVQYEEIVPEEPETAHRGILCNFADAVLHGVPLIAPGEEGIRELTISNAAYLSSWTDNWAELPLDEALYARLLQEKVDASDKTPLFVSQGSSQEYSERWQVRW
ncbi:MAG: Gfo/Idh/MocA family oxidoreductase [Clostridiaceae bacterium]|nr:Gfo/Idh/MocA family oxidoreductase [Clostridiaceae bacterium]